MGQALRKAARGFRRHDNGSFTLESVLIAALLALTATASLLLLGDSIACLFQKQAGEVSHAGFWAEAVNVVPSSGNGSLSDVSWSTEGVTGPFDVMRFRPGTPNQDYKDVQSWTAIATNVEAPPARNLDVRPGDYVVIVANRQRCDYSLLSPFWPDGNGPGDPVATGAPSFVAATTASGSGGHRDWLTGFNGSFATVWSVPLVLDDGSRGDAWATAIATDTAYVGLMSEPSGTSIQEGIYSTSIEASGEPGLEAAVPRFVQDSAGTQREVLTTKDNFIAVSLNGAWLMTRAGAKGSPGSGFLVAYLGNDADTPRFTYAGTRPYGMTFGLDGKAYALVDEGGDWRVRQVAIPAGTLSGGFDVPGAAETAMGLAGGNADGVTLQGVGQDGTAYFHAASGTADAFALAADGTLSRSLPAGTATGLSGRDMVFAAGSSAYLRFPASGTANPDVVPFTGGTPLRSPLWTSTDAAYGTDSVAELLSGPEGDHADVAAKDMGTSVNVVSTVPSLDAGVMHVSSPMQDASLDGRLLDAEGHALSGRTVTLMRKNAGSEVWMPVETSSPTRSDGTFDFSTKASPGDTFRFDFAGDVAGSVTYLPSQSGEVPVDDGGMVVSPTPTAIAIEGGGGVLAIPSGSDATIEGTLTAADSGVAIAGEAVALERLVDGTDWVTQAWATSGSDGKLSAVQSGVGDGWTYRWHYPGHGGYLPSVSVPVVLDLLAPQDGQQGAETQAYTYELWVNGKLVSSHDFRAVPGSVYFNPVAESVSDTQATHYAVPAAKSATRANLVMPVIRVDNSVVAVAGSTEPPSEPAVAWVPQAFKDHNAAVPSYGGTYGSDWGMAGYSGGVTEYSAAGAGQTSWLAAGWPTSGSTHRYGDTAWGTPRPNEWGRTVNSDGNNGHTTALGSSGTVDGSAAYELCIMLSKDDQRTADITGGYARDWWSTAGIGQLSPAGVDSPSIRVRMNMPVASPGDYPATISGVAAGLDGRPLASQAAEFAGVNWVDGSGSVQTWDNYTVQSGKPSGEAGYPAVAAGDRGDIMHGGTAVSSVFNRQTTGVTVEVRVTGGVVKPYQRGRVWLGDTTPPSRATGLVGHPWVTTGFVTLDSFSATDNVGVVGYAVQMDGNTIGTAMNATSISIRGVPTGSHTFAVAARDAAGNQGAWSDAVTVEMATDPEAPTQVVGLKATTSPNQPDNITVSGYQATDNRGVDSYELEVTPQDTGVQSLRSQGVYGVMSNAASFVVTIPAAQKTYTLTGQDHGIQPGRIYDFRMRAVDRDGNRGAWSATVTNAADSEPPAKVTGVAATSQEGENAVVLTYRAATDNVGVAGYDFELDGKSGDHYVQDARTTYEFSGLEKATTYSFRVRAYDAAGNKGPWSDTVTARTTEDPSKTTGLVVTPWLTGAKATLSGYTATDDMRVTSFEIERDGERISWTIVKPGSSYVDAPLASGRQYTYRMRAYDAAGNTGAWSEPVTVTVGDDSEAPSKATGLKVADYHHTENLVELYGFTATDDSGIAGFDVERDGSVVATTGAGTTYLDRGLVAHSSHTYRVRAFDGQGNRGEWSDSVTGVAGDGEAPSQTTGLAAAQWVGGILNVNLTGFTATDNVGVDHYEIQRRVIDGNQSEYTWVFALNSPYAPAIDAGLLNRTYEYRVRAWDGPDNSKSNGNPGPWSDPVRITVGDVTPPTQVTGLQLTPWLTEKKVTVSGYTASDDVGVAGYEVERMLLNDSWRFVATVTLSPFIDEKDLVSGGRYSYSVRAYDAAGNYGPWSDLRNVTVFNDGSVPGKPVGLVAVPWLTEDSIDLRGFYVPAAAYPDVAGWDVERDGTVVGVDYGPYGSSLPGDFAVYRDRHLGQGTTHSYRVRAVNAGGNRGPWSEPVTATTVGGSVPPTDTTPPSAVEGLQATPWVSDPYVNLTGYHATDDSGSVEYLIYRDGQILGWAHTEDGYVDGPLAPGTVHSYCMFAWDGTNYGPQSETVTVTVTGDLVLPAPVGFQANWFQDFGIGSFVSLSDRAFQPLPGVPVYGGWEIEKNGELLASLPAGEIVEFLDFAVAENTHYAYRLRAYDLLGTRGPWSEPVNVFRDTIAPAKVADLAGNYHREGNYRYHGLTWSESTDVSGIHYYDVEIDGDESPYVTHELAFNVLFADDTPHTYRVRAEDNAGNSGEWSDPVTISPANPDGTVPTKVTGLVATPWSSSPWVNLSGYSATDDKGVTGYDIQRSGDGETWAGGTWSVQTTDGYIDTTTEEGRTYYYRMRARDAFGNRGAWSDTVSVDTWFRDATPPSKPEGLLATPWSSNGGRMTLHGAVATDDRGTVAGYDVLRDGNAVGTADASGMFVDTGLTPSTSYTYQVRAFDPTGNRSEWSEPATATTSDHAVAEPVALAAIGGLSGGLSVQGPWDTQFNTYNRYDTLVSTGMNLTVSSSEASLPVRNSLEQFNGAAYRSTIGRTVLAFDKAGIGTVRTATLRLVSRGIFSGGMVLTAATDDAVTNTNRWSVATGAELSERIPVSQTSFAGDPAEFVLNQAGIDYLNAVGDTARFCIRSTGDADHNINLPSYDGSFWGTNPTANGGQAAWAPQLIVTVGNEPPDITAPGKTEGLLLTPWVSGPTMGLSWAPTEDPSGISRYDIQRSENDRDWTDVGSTSQWSYNDPGLSRGTAYWYRVRAVDGNGNTGAWSDAVTATTVGADTTPPIWYAEPLITPWVSDGSRMSISFYYAVDDQEVGGYELQRDGVTIAHLPATSQANASFVDTGLEAGTTYAYRMRAYDASGNNGEWSSTVSVTTWAPDTTPPGLPTGLVVSQVGDSGGTSLLLTGFSATDDRGIQGYQAQRSSDGGQNWTDITYWLYEGEPYTDTGLTPGTAYTYRVRAVDLSWNAGGYGVPVTAMTQSFDTMPPSKATFTVTPSDAMASVSVGGFQATDDFGVAGYEVERDGSIVGTAEPGGTYTDGGLAESSLHSYRVRAYDAAGNRGAWGTMRNAVVWPAVMTPVVVGAGDGTVRNQGPLGTWDTLRNSPTGTAAFAVAKSISVAALYDTGQNLDSVYRGFLTFSLAAVPADALTGARVTIYKASTTAYTGDLALFQGNQSDALSTADFGAFTGPELAVRVPSPTDAGQAATFVLNEAGVAYLRSVGAGTARFCVRTAADVDGIEPTSSISNSFNSYESGGTYRPVLEVTTDRTADITAPSMVAGLLATPWSSGPYINLHGYSATDDKGVAGYEVERSSDGGTTWDAIGTAPTADGYVDTTSLAGATYSYRMRAYDAAGNRGAWSDTVSATATGDTVTEVLADGTMTGYVGAKTPTYGTAGEAFTPGNWAIARDGGTGAVFTSASNSVTMRSTAYAYSKSTAPAAYYYRVDRMLLSFTRPGSGAVTAAELVLTADKAGPAGQELVLFASDHASISSSLDSFDSGYGVELGRAPEPPNAGGKVVFTLNQAGLDYVNAVGGTVKLCVRSAADASNTAPAQSGYSLFRGPADVIANAPVLRLTVSGTAGDTTPPSKAAGLVATPWNTAPLVTLSGYAATDDNGVAGYEFEHSTDGSSWNAIGSTADATALDTDAVAGTTYWYRVRAFDAAGNRGEWSDLAFATANDMLPPSQVTGLAATAWGTAPNVTLSGYTATDDSPITAYEVERDGTSLGTTTDASYVDAGLDEGSEHSYRVRACGFIGWGEWSEPVSVTVGTSISAVTGISATPNLMSPAITLYGYTATTGWGSNAPVSYQIERTGGTSGTVTTSTSNPAYTTPAGGGSGTVAATTYSFRMRAFDGTSYGPWSGTVTATTITPPQLVTGMALTPTGAGEITVSGYTALPGTSPVGRFALYRNTAASSTGQTIVSTTLLPGSSYADTGLVEGTTYYYRMRAYDANSAAGSLGSWVAVTMTAPAADSVPPSRVSGLVASPWTTATYVNLSGYTATDDSAVTGYDIERSEDGGNSWTPLGTVATTDGYIDTATSETTAYWYRIRAFDAAGNKGDWSDTVSVITADLTPPNVPSFTATPWTTMSAVTLSGYEMYGEVAACEVERDGVSLGETPNSTFEDGGLADSTAYSYRMRARDTAGNWSAWSDPVTATTGHVAQGVLSVPASAGDAYVMYTSAATWAQAHDAAAGTSANTTNTTLVVRDVFATGTYSLMRSFVPFDTSALSLPATFRSIDAATFSVTNATTSGNGKSIVLVAGTPANPNAPAAADFTAFGTAELASRVTWNSAVTYTRQVFPLNPAGMATINRSGWTVFCLRTANDADYGPAPTDSTDYFTAASSTHGNLSARPTLDIYYSYYTN